MKTYICDYALTSPAILANRITFMCDQAWCDWLDIDEDRFELRVFSIFENEELSAEELARVDALVKPFLYEG